MSKALEYQGYFGAVEFDYDDHTFYGDVINMRDVIAFEGKTVEELESSFRTAVDARSRPGRRPRRRSASRGIRRCIPGYAPREPLSRKRLRPVLAIGCAVRPMRLASGTGWRQRSQTPETTRSSAFSSDAPPWHESSKGIYSSRLLQNAGPGV
jgi:hypothetical protein